MASAKHGAAGAAPMRPPAVPLVTCDPYFSVWSMADRLTDDLTRHWTGKVQSMFGMARIDGHAYRFLGVYCDLPAMTQVGLEVLPTRTIARFEAGGIELEVVFLTPLLPHDLGVLARPVTYIVWTARAIDGKGHEVSVYFDVSASLAVNSAEQKVNCGRFKLGGMAALTAASLDQAVLGRSGDDLRIDWGTLYLVRPAGPGAEVVALDSNSRPSFILGTYPLRSTAAASGPRRTRCPSRSAATCSS